MDNHKTGALIAQCRREKGLTQQQLADQLFLSNKTISKWECGAGCPDPATLPALAAALDVSVDELLNGCRMPDSAAVSAAADCPKPARTWPVALGAAIGAILGILAYNHGWLG